MELGFEEAVTSLKERGLWVQDAFLDETTIGALREELQSLRTQGAFRSAGIGRKKRHVRDRSIRSDLIYWLDPLCLTAPQTVFWQALEKWRQALNRRCYLGLSEVEAHYAVYSPGAHYQAHVDRFQDDNSRILSFVLYLNEAWSAEDGGALRIHGASPFDIFPAPGRWVTFLSSEIRHEVLPPRRERFTLTGWFRESRRW